MAHDVFVSHSAKDKTVADAMVAKLEAEGVRCWVAPRDVIPGADWGESIINAIESSRIMVLIFSESANGSPQIKREVERAVHNSVYTIPFRIDNIEPTKSLEYFISTAHWLDAYSPPLGEHLKSLTRTIKAILETLNTGVPGATIAAPPDQMNTPQGEKKGAEAFPASSPVFAPPPPAIPTGPSLPPAARGEELKTVGPAMRASPRLSRTWRVLAILALLFVLGGGLFFLLKPRPPSGALPETFGAFLRKTGPGHDNFYYDLEIKPKDAWWADYDFGGTSDFVSCQVLVFSSPSEAHQALDLLFPKNVPATKGKIVRQGNRLSKAGEVFTVFEKYETDPAKGNGPILSRNYAAWTDNAMVVIANSFPAGDADIRKRLAERGPSDPLAVYFMNCYPR